MEIEFVKKFAEDFHTDGAIYSDALIALSEQVLARFSYDSRDEMKMRDKDIYQKEAFNATLLAAEMVLAVKNGGGVGRAYATLKGGVVTNGFHGAVCRSDVSNMRRLLEVRAA